MTKTEIICLTPTSEDVDEMSQQLAQTMSGQTNDTSINATTAAPPTTAAPMKKKLYAGNRGAFVEMFNSTTGYHYSNGKLKVNFFVEGTC